MLLESNTSADCIVLIYQWKEVYSSNILRKSLRSLHSGGQAARLKPKEAWKVLDALTVELFSADSNQQSAEFMRNPLPLLLNGYHG